MGRTKRERTRKKSSLQKSLDHDPNTIQLKQFMIQNGFKKMFNLQLNWFPNTGRGVGARRRFVQNEILIQIPYNLMITYTTILRSLNSSQLFNFKPRLQIHDLLSIFLVLEQHKKHSFWECYINSLPDEPPWLPLHLSLEQMELLPADLSLEAKKSRRLLEESFLRLKKSIRNDWICSCCYKGIDCVLDMNKFTWAYIMVNTRAVYVDPIIVRKNCDIRYDQDILSDEPCMALCPFLDMFNHSWDCRTEAELVYLKENTDLVFQLKTLTGYKKFEQIYISYGAHDNVKLITEYGFYIPGNNNDAVIFNCEGILKIFKLSLSAHQRHFINNHKLCNDLFINISGCSFNLRAFLFVAFLGNSVENLSSVIFKDLYPDNFRDEIKDICKKLLYYELNITENCCSSLDGYNCPKLINEYLLYRKGFIRSLYNKLLL